MNQLLGHMVGAVGGSHAPAAYHTTSYSPVGLWQFNTNKNDSSGNGLNLSLGAGAEIYAALGGTRLVGAFFNGASYFVHAYDALLKITGALTVEMLLAFPIAPVNATDYWILNFGAAGGGGEPNNILYSTYITSQIWGYWARKDAAVNIRWEIAKYRSSVGLPNHLAMTRSAGQVVKYYINGHLFGTSGVLDTPTGGTASTLWIGCDNVGTARVPIGTIISSVKICASELTGAQILGEAQSTIGISR
jgi:hypothetical protein